MDVFAFVRVGRLICSGFGPGRSAKHRLSLACASLAKAVFDLSTTQDLIERLLVVEKLRRPRGWPSEHSVPGGATYSRAFAESSLPARLQQVLVERCLGGVWSGTSRGIRPRSRRAGNRLRSRTASGVGRARARSVRRSRAGWNGSRARRFAKCRTTCRKHAMWAARRPL